MALTAFGPRAESYAARLPAALEAIVFDELGFAEALAEALERANRSRPFFAVPVVAHRRSAEALEAVPGLLASNATYAERRAQFERLTESIAPDGGMTRKERDSIRDVLLASDAVLVRSWSELNELARLLDVRPSRSARAVARPAHALPNVVPAGDARTIVVWAPELVASQAALFAFALEELHAPVAVICAGVAEPTAFGLRARFIDVADVLAVARAFTDAAAIVAAAVDDPSPAIALAALGVPVAAAFVCGAHEYVDNLCFYDHWNVRSILQATLAALGGDRPILRGEIPQPESLVLSPAWSSVPQPPSDPPLVSVIIPTRDRHAILPRAVDSVARQRYPNVELVLVNDGGAPVDEIAQRFARTTVVNRPESGGVTLASIEGFAASKGRYVTLIGDDDYLFPDHLARLVHALERSGASVALGMVMCSYLQRGSDESYELFGTALEQIAAVDPTELRRGVIGVIGTALLVRREAVEAIGGWDAAAGHGSDLDAYLSLMERYDWVFVPHVLANFDVRMDGSNVHLARADEAARLLRYIFEKHPSGERPDIDAARAQVLAYNEGSAPKPYLQRGVTRLATPKPGIYRL